MKIEPVKYRPQSRGKIQTADVLNIYHVVPIIEC